MSSKNNKRSFVKSKKNTSVPNLVNEFVSNKILKDFRDRLESLHAKVFSNEIVLSEIIDSNSIYNVFISICNKKNRAIVIKGGGSTLESAWQDSAKKTEKYIRDNNYNALWIKTDIVHKTEKIDIKNLSLELSHYHKKFFRKGISFDESFDIAFLEAELNGNKLINYSKHRLNPIKINKYLNERGIYETVRIPDNVILFSCVGFFCDDSNIVYELYTDELNYGRRKVDFVNKEVAVDLIRNASNFLSNSLQEDGKFVYGYFPTYDKLILNYNILRHAGTTWSLICQYKTTGNKELIPKIDSAINFLVGKNIEFKDADTAFVIERKSNEVKLGGNAITIISLIDYMREFKTDKFRELVICLGNGILDCLDMETGQYYHVLHFPSYERKEEFRTIFYEGESTFALCKLYGFVNQEKYLTAAAATVENFIRKDYTRYIDHWIAYALNEITKYRPDKRYFEFALRNVTVNLDKIYNQKTTAHIFFELLMASFDLYDRIIEDNIQLESLDKFNKDYFIEAIFYRAHHMLNGYFYPEYAMYFKSPFRILNTFFIRNDAYRVRIDDVQHFVGGYYYYYLCYDRLMKYKTNDCLKKEINLWSRSEKKDNKTIEKIWKPNKKALAIRLGENDSIKCMLDGEDIKVEWTIDDTNIARVDESGNVSAVSKGNTIVNAYYNSEKVLSVPVYIDRDVLPPLSPITEPRFKLVDGIYVNPDADNQKDKATLMFVGDIMCLSGQQRPAMTNNTYNFNASFDYVKPIFEKADFVTGNLETMLSQTAPYKWEQSRIMAPKGITTNCNAPVTFLDAIRYAGFDAVMTSNNHCLDTGIQGVKETLENINRYKILNTGMFSKPDDTRYLLVNVNGIKIGLLSYTATIFNSWEWELTQEECDTHINAYSIEKVKSDIDLLKSKGTEYIVVYIRWGPINTPVINKNQFRRGQELADAGVDYIIGSHPHVLMKHDILQAKDGKKVPIIYSMGNFLSSMDQVEDKLNRDTIILQLELIKDENEVKLVDERYVPCFVCKTFRGKRYVIMPCDKNINGGYESENIIKSNERIKAALGEKINFCNRES